jgi:hypothetical protein
MSTTFDIVAGMLVLLGLAFIAGYSLDTAGERVRRQRSAQVARALADERRWLSEERKRYVQERSMALEERHRLAGQHQRLLELLVRSRQEIATQVAPEPSTRGLGPAEPAEPAEPAPGPPNDVPPLAA